MLLLAVLATGCLVMVGACVHPFAELANWARYVRVSPDSPPR
jgi:hypothetical protein